jgi:hypothetical protein
MSRLASALTALVLLAGAVACGDDGGSGAADDQEARPYVESVRQSLDDSENPWTAAQSDCFAEQFVGAVGVEYFEENDIAPEDLAGDELEGFPGLEPDQIDRIAGTFDDCDIDLYASITETDGMDIDRECLEDEIDHDTLARLVAASFGGQELRGDDREREQEFIDALTHCSSAGAGTDGSEDDGADG